MLVCLFLFLLLDLRRAQTCDPPCANGGACIAPNTCYCVNPGFSGQTCQLYHCLNGGTPAPSGVCTCPKNWSGIRCGVCESSDVCSSGKICDQTIDVVGHYMKYVSCKVLPPLGETLGSNITIQMDIDATQPEEHGKLYMQAWQPNRAKPNAGIELFWCTFTDCHETQLNGNVAYDCAKSECECTSLCSPTLRSVIAMATGTVHVECTLENECSFKQQQIPFTGKLDCKLGGCR